MSPKLEVKPGETIIQASERQQYQTAIDRTEAIFVALEKAGMLRLPSGMWGWAEATQTAKRVIIQAGWKIMDAYPPHSPRTRNKPLPKEK